jgi:hypothetical protein
MRDQRLGFGFSYSQILIRQSLFPFTFGPCFRRMNGV